MKRSEEREFVGLLHFINLIVYLYLKTVNIMARFELKFLDCSSNGDFIQTEITNTETDLGNVINIFGKSDNDDFCIWLDKSTAIKFAKTLRTEINKITESEVKND